MRALDARQYRIGLENLKRQHAADPDQSEKAQRLRQRELEDYVENAQREYKTKHFLKDVYVTDHTPKEKKYNTNNSKEDEDFYNYHVALENYNKDAKKGASLPRTSKQDSLFNEIEDHRTGMKREADGSFTIEISESELLIDEDIFKAEYEKYKSGFYDQNLDGSVGEKEEGEEGEEDEEEEEEEEGGDKTEDKFHRAMVGYDDPTDKSVYLKKFQKELEIFPEG